MDEHSGTSERFEEHRARLRGQWQARRRRPMPLRYSYPGNTAEGWQGCAMALYPSRRLSYFWIEIWVELPDIECRRFRRPALLIGRKAQAYERR